MTALHFLDRGQSKEKKGLIVVWIHPGLVGGKKSLLSGDLFDCDANRHLVFQHVRLQGRFGLGQDRG